MKRILITGASRGIGRAIAAKLAAPDVTLLLHGRDTVALAETCEAVGSSCAGVVKLIHDLATEKGVTNLIAQVGDEPLHVLINNAGILLDEDKSALRITPKIFDATLRTNTLGPLLVAEAFLPFLEKSDAPRIVNVSSGGGQLADGADGWAPAYCISKTALNGVTSQLAAALPKFAINSVCPGWVRTDMGGSSATRSVEEGASGIVWLAADAPQNETGKFWRDRKVIPW